MAIEADVESAHRYLTLICVIASFGLIEAKPAIALKTKTAMTAATTKFYTGPRLELFYWNQRKITTNTPLAAAVSSTRVAVGLKELAKGRQRRTYLR